MLGNLLRKVELDIRTHILHHIEPGALVRIHCHIGVVVVVRIWVGVGVDSLHNLQRMRNIVLHHIEPGILVRIHFCIGVGGLHNLHHMMVCNHTHRLHDDHLHHGGHVHLRRDNILPQVQPLQLMPNLVVVWFPDFLEDF